MLPPMSACRWSAHGWCSDARRCAGPEHGRQQGVGLLAEEVEIVYCVFDLLQYDGHSIAHEPLQRRHELLRQAIVPCPVEGWVLQSGKTAVTARVVPILPGSQPLVPGCPASQFWSVQIRTAAELLVRACQGAFSLSTSRAAFQCTPLQSCSGVMNRSSC